MTSEQINWLNNLTCQRLSEDDANDNLRLVFDNDRVDSLVDFITSPDTMATDSNGDIAIYVIKDDNEIIAYFSIQCGNVFEAIIKDEDRLFYKIYKQSNARSAKDQEWLINYQAEHNLSHSDMKILADKIEEKIKSVEPKKHDDARLDEIGDIKIVNKTIPAIEIVHFCKNDLYDGQYHELFHGVKLGELLFMTHIVPVLKKVREVIGCKLVYLFAVTNERDNKLIAHYHDNFGFNINTSFGVNKSLRETGCLFMVQSLDDLFKTADSYEPTTHRIHD